VLKQYDDICKMDELDHKMHRFIAK